MRITHQIKFDATINLLILQGEAHSYVRLLLDIYKHIMLVFDACELPSEGTTKEVLLDIYEMHWRMEEDRKSNPHVFGYDTLLPNFRQTKLEYICISNFIIDIGTFLIFSDFERNELIGCGG